MIKLSFKKKSSISQEFLNSKLGMRESMGEDFSRERGEGVALILSLCEGGGGGGLKLIFG